MSKVPEVFVCGSERLEDYDWGVLTDWTDAIRRAVEHLDDWEIDDSLALPAIAARARELAAAAIAYAEWLDTAPPMTPNPDVMGGYRVYGLWGEYSPAFTTWLREQEAARPKGKK